MTALYIGTAIGCEVRLRQHPAVADWHAKVWRTGSGDVMICELNGEVLIHDERVSVSGAALRPRDVIRLRHPSRPLQEVRLPTDRHLLLRHPRRRPQPQRQATMTVEVDAERFKQAAEQIRLLAESLRPTVTVVSVQ